MLGTDGASLASSARGAPQNQASLSPHRHSTSAPVSNQGGNQRWTGVLCAAPHGSLPWSAAVVAVILAVRGTAAIASSIPLPTGAAPSAALHV